MAEGMPPSGSGGGGPTSVPISANVAPAGQETINGILYNKFTVNLSATNNQSQTVGLSVPSGCFVNPNSVSISPPFAGTATVWIPASNNSTVNATATETGYENKAIQVQSGA